MGYPRSQRRIDALIAVLLIAGGLALFLPNLGFAPAPFFDEYRYVPAARQILSGMNDGNWSHPPLGKVLISIGMWIFGETPLGWRVMSALFGSLTLVGMYHWGLALFRRRSLAIEVALISLLNQLLFVQSRIAMLDVFMFAFISFGMASLTRYWLDPATSGPGNVRPEKAFVLDAGLSFGLALATKWFALVPVILGAALLIAADRRKKAFLKVKAALTLIGVSIATYAVVFLLAIGAWHPREFVTLQGSMYQAQTRFEAPHHPYRDSWIEWPLMLKPIWYGYLTAPLPGNDWEQGVLFVGNPAILWGGALAVIACALLAVMRKSKVAALVAGSYFAFWASWAVIPRNALFFYYYFPAAMVLGLAIVLVFDEFKAPLWAKAAAFAIFALTFAYFFPLISGRAMRGQDFQNRLWLPGWRATAQSW